MFYLHSMHPLCLSWVDVGGPVGSIGKLQQIGPLLTALRPNAPHPPLAWPIRSLAGGSGEGALGGPHWLVLDLPQVSLELLVLELGPALGGSRGLWLVW